MKLLDESREATSEEVAKARAVVALARRMLAEGDVKPLFEGDTPPVFAALDKAAGWPEETFDGPSRSLAEKLLDQATPQPKGLPAWIDGTEIRLPFGAWMDEEQPKLTQVMRVMLRASMVREAA